MILFDLKCAKGHVFEGWFRDGEAYEAQAAGRKIACPACGSRRIAKAPMAPRIGKRSDAGVPAPKPPPPPAPSDMALREALRELRAHVEATSDYVGPRFAEEARRIHRGEGERRGIYGEASEQEARELDDEGIAYARIPWVPRHDG